MKLKIITIPFYFQQDFPPKVLRGEAVIFPELFLKIIQLKAGFSGVPQGSVLGSLFFLVYINDLADNLASDVRLFADDTSLFTIVYDETVSAQVLNFDLKTIEEWAYQWKMQFDPDVNKQAVQVIFSQKNI